MLTTTALVAAADGVINPTTPDYLAMGPLQTTLEMVTAVKNAYQPGCELTGIVINAQAKTSEHTYHRSQIAESFKGRMLGSVPRRAAIQDVASTGEPLSSTRTGPAAGLREDYTQMAANLVTILNRKDQTS